MMIYEVAMVEDHGSYWSVHGVTQSAFETVDKEYKYLKLSAVSGKLMKDAINDGHEVRVIKPLRSMEVLPSEIRILEVKPDDLDAVKQSQIKRVMMVVHPEVVSVSALTYYGFTCLNNELADKGFFITDSNRESKYLSILETGDEKLITLLEDYLNYKDEISEIASLFKRFEQFRRSVKAEESVEKIQQLADNFLETYYAFARL
jgi:hypothetical protein